MDLKGLLRFELKNWFVNQDHQFEPSFNPVFLSKKQKICFDGSRSLYRFMTRKASKLLDAIGLVGEKKNKEKSKGKKLIDFQDNVFKGKYKCKTIT